MSTKLISQYMNELSKATALVNKESLASAIEIIRNSQVTGNKVFTLGNGGSANTASHYVTDWNKAVFENTGKCFSSICLADNIGILTAYANDNGYEFIFSKQLENLASQNDVVIAISGSGNSKNLVNALLKAKQLGLKTIGVLGFDGGLAIDLVDVAVHIPSFDMQICEDFHLTFGHIVMKSLTGIEVE